MARNRAKDETTMAESGRDPLSERTRAALARKRARGEKLGGDVPFGYRAEGNRLVPDAREEGVIGLMRRLRGEGLGLRKIAARLNDLDHRQKRGGRWSHVAVDRTLKRDGRRPPVDHGPESAEAREGNRAPSPVPPPGVPQEPSEPRDDPPAVAAVTQAPEDRPGTLERMVSDGRPGAGEAARRAAQAAGLATGGERSVRANVRDSDLTLWFGDDTGTAAAQAMIGACDELGRPWVRVVSGFTRSQDIARRLRGDGVKVLHVAGEPESRAPGIVARVERFLADVFRWLG